MHAPSKSTASFASKSAGLIAVASGLWPEFHRLSGICSRHSLDATGFAEVSFSPKNNPRGVGVGFLGVSGNFFNGCYNSFSLPTNLFKVWMNSLDRPMNSFRGWMNFFNGWTNSFSLPTNLFEGRTNSFRGRRNLFNHSSNSFSR